MPESKARQIRAEELTVRAHDHGLPRSYRVDHVEVIPEHDGNGIVRLDVYVVDASDEPAAEDSILDARIETERAIFDALSDALSAT